MRYDQVVAKVIREDGVAQSTMMKTPRLRYKGEFIAMMFEKEDSLIIKGSAERVDGLIAEGQGMAFNFTKKRFEQRVLIPREFDDKYDAYIDGALRYVKKK